MADFRTAVLNAPREYGPPKTLYDRWKRWGDMGVFARMIEGLASEGGDQKTIMIDVEAGQRHRFERPAEGI